MSTVTRDLIERGVIQEVGTRREEMGRPSIMLRLRSEYAFFVGINITGGEARALLADLGGRVRAQVARPTPDNAPEAVVALLCTLVDELLKESKVEPNRLRGVGLALSGLIDNASGVCINSTVLGWQNVPIGQMLTRALRLEVSVENDANAVALGERLFGEAEHHGNFAVVSLGRGVGAGIFIAGELHRGVSGVSGELGHCTVELDGPLCRCGKRGCLEAVAAVPILVAAARDQGLTVSSLEDLEELASGGDARAVAILSRAGAALGLALSNLVNLFSPELVILTGSGTALGPTLEAATRECYEAHVLPMLPARPTLLFRHEDGAVWARGAAGLAALAFLKAGGEVMTTM